MNKDECARCQVKLSYISRPTRFGSKLQRTEVTVLVALQELFGKSRGFREFTPSNKKNAQDNRRLCSSCGHKLSKLYTSWKEFTESTDSTSSYIHTKLKPMKIGVETRAVLATPYDDNDVDGANEFKKPDSKNSIMAESIFPSKASSSQNKSNPLSLRRTIVNARRSKQGRQVINNVFYQILSTEMKEFTLNTSLKNQIQTLDDIPDWTAIKLELEQYAPTTLLAINAMAGNSDQSKLMASLGTAICIITNTRSMFCNKLQKCIGFVLRQSHTKQTVFDFLQDLRISASAKTLANTIDELTIRKDYNAKGLKETDKAKFLGNPKEANPKKQVLQVLPPRKKRKTGLNRISLPGSTSTTPTIQQSSPEVQVMEFEISYVPISDAKIEVS